MHKILAKAVYPVLFPMPHMIRSDVLAATVDVREAWGEKDAITMEKASVWMVGMWKTGMLVKELPSCYSSGS